MLFSLRSDSEWFIFGDINICVKQKQSLLYRQYEQNLKLFNLKQLNNEPTRITENTSSVIDLILCSDVSKVCQSGTIPVGISDHLVTFFTRKILKDQFNKH